MAYQHAHSDHGTDFHLNPWAIIKSVAGLVGGFFVAISVANRRIAEMEALQAKSDAQLAKMGLRREDIARHVFRDTLHL